jgi:hypothetical protein
MILSYDKLILKMFVPKTIFTLVGLNPANVHTKFGHTVMLLIEEN